MTHESQDRLWREAGFDEAFVRHCSCHGWSFADVATVLCSDAFSEYPLDWCYSGLDPLEVHDAIRAGQSAPCTHRTHKVDSPSRASSSGKKEKIYGRPHA